MGLRNVVPHLRRLIDKRGPPLHLTFFVTARCNAVCRHCFYHENLNQGQRELTLDEVDRIASSIPRALWIAFTGGEPFLRDDLPEFAGILHDRLRPVTLSINTNGIRTDEIAASAERLAARCPNTFVGILCSLDGLKETHDRIRGVPRNFERTVATYRELRRLQKGLPNLGVGISTTYCAWNQDEIDEMFDFVVDELAPDNWDLSFVRGRPMEPAIGVADIGRYRAIKARLERAFADGRLRYYEGMPLAGFVRAKERLSAKTVLATLETGQYQLPCHAGALSAVISEEGDVYACELLDQKLGNLREAGYDLARLWESAQARDLRHWIRDTKCFCTHECNMSINLLFNPALYPRIAAEMLSGSGLSSHTQSPGAAPHVSAAAPIARHIPIVPVDRPGR